MLDSISQDRYREKPWVIGAEWDSATSIGDYFRGCMDDFMLTQRTLSSEEVARLMTKSPVVGLHRAKLVVRTDGEVAAREIDLRAEVRDKTEMIIIGEDIPGQTVQIDGEDRTAPVAIAIGGAATSDSEWATGSMHTVSVPGGYAVENAEGDTVNYALQSAGDSGVAMTKTVCATRGMGDYVVDYAMTDVDDGDDPPPASGANANHQSLVEALGGTPRGPFVRLSDGDLSIPAAGDFALEGSVFVSPTRMKACSVVRRWGFPTRFLENGWSLGRAAGSSTSRLAPISN